MTWVLLPCLTKGASVSLEQPEHDRRIAYLKELGCDIAWKYEHTQSGYVHYSVTEPENYEYQLNRITEVPIQEVPHWAIRQLEI